MLKLSPSTSINEDFIESILENNSKPVEDIQRGAKKAGAYQKLVLRNEQAKSIVRMTDGFVYVCPRETATYIKYVSGDYIKTGSRCYIRKDLIREIASIPEGKKTLSRAYKDRIAVAKENGCFFNLCKNRSARHYIILTNGVIYSAYSFKGGGTDE